MRGDAPAQPGQVAGTYTRIPDRLLDMLPERKLSDGAAVTYAVLVRHRTYKTNRVQISQETLAAHRGRSERQVFTHLHELVEAGLIEPVNPVNGRCSDYRITDLTAAGGFSAFEPDRRTFSHKAPQSASALPPQSASANQLVQEKFKRRKKSKGRTTQVPLERVIEALQRCNLSVEEARKESDRLNRRNPGQRARLLGNLMHALDQNELDPIGYADRRTAGGYDAPRTDCHGDSAAT